MAITYGAGAIVTNGLQMFLDSANVRSYDPAENLWPTSETALYGSVAGGTSSLVAGGGPFGGAAWQINVTNGTNNYLFDTSTSVTVGEIITHSAYVKSVSSPPINLIVLRYWTGSGRAWTTDRWAYFNLATETMYGTSGNVLNAQIQNIGNDWYRLSITCMADQTGTAAISVYGSSFIPTGGQYLVAGTQVEKNYGPGKYTATSGATVTKPTTWTDLSGNGNNCTLNGNPAFDNVRTGGAFIFNPYTINQWGDVTLDYRNTPYTMITAGRYVGYNQGYSTQQSGRMFTTSNNNWLHGFWGGNVNAYYAEGWVSTYGQPINAYDQNWHVNASTGDTTSDMWELYDNATLLFRNNQGSQGPYNLSIARSGNFGEYATCHVGFVMVYNRVLSQAEIVRTTNALKGRYSL